ncbi:MAG TPA: hypothetical protein PLV25_07225, partial [Opitutales bacterium]|nr:hypothetical protein [Opitutales bacterium]
VEPKVAFNDFSTQFNTGLDQLLEDGLGRDRDNAQIVKLYREGIVTKGKLGAANGVLNRTEQDVVDEVSDIFADDSLPDED